MDRDQTPSSGLGLYISKRLAESMGGNIILEQSHIDKGTIFGVKLPLASNQVVKEPVAIDNSSKPIPAAAQWNFSK